MVSYPQDWEEKNVKDFGYVVTGNTPSTNVSEYWGRTYTWITPTDINRKIFISSSERRLTEKGYSVSRRLPSGSVLVTCIASIGKNCILQGSGSCNQQINAICVNDKNYNLFIYYLMEFNKQYLENLAGITATKIIKKQIFENIEFIVPPLLEQQAIADALTTFDMHINNLAKLIEKKKMIRDGAVEDLVSGKRRLAGFSGKWKVCVLNNVVEILNGDRGFNYPSSNDMKAYGVPFINTGNIKDGYVSFDDMEYITKEKYNALGGGKIKKHDILFCLRGSIGKFAYVNFNCGAPASSLCIIRGLSAIKSKFLFYSLSSNASIESVKQLNSGSSQPNISAKELKTIDIKIPSSLSEQQAIADILTAMDKEIANLEKEKEKYIALKAGAMDDLLTGKIRLA